MPPHRVCYSKSGYALCNSGQLLCGRAELAVSHTAVHNIIENKREILGVLIGRNLGGNRERIGMKNRMTVLIVIRFGMKSIANAPNIFYVLISRGRELLSQGLDLCLYNFIHIIG